ncbi:MAG: radical SAM protein [Candidatus Omnitrophica bacterium]|nr:radical SAM protein [Candidatus Omnitrophota bacterium]
MSYSFSDSRKRILVIAPPYRLNQTAYALGLMYIAAVLERAGHYVEVIDMDVRNLPMDDYIRELKTRNYDYVCTGGMITAWNFLVFTVNLVKELRPRVKVIVGGGIVSSTPKHFMAATKADAGVIGEGEDTVLHLIRTFENGQSLSTVDGIVYREGSEVIQTKERKNIQDLDALPFPAWELFNVGQTYSRYPSHHSIIHAKRFGSIYTTRGCPFQCTFCYTEKAVRQRSVENVIAEIKELKDRYGVGHVMIADDLFVVRKKYVVEFCEAMIKQKINVTWSCTGRCNIIDREFLRICKSAGCDFMGLGIESGSAAVLKAIKKNQTPQQIVEAVKMVQEAGITPGGTFILGLPPETKETMRETAEIYKTINQYRTHVNKFFFATPYPGTELYTQMKTAGKITDEIAYFEKISERGDAVDFVMNCTDAISDEDLMRLKKELENEVMQDFIAKHPFLSFQQWWLHKTPWGKIRTALIMLKMKGFRENMQFLWTKILAKLKLIPDPYHRTWSKRKTYAYAQTLIEGRMVTF